MSDFKKHYQRVIITGELYCHSNLHIGTGKPFKQDGLEQLISEYCTDVNGRAIIPASSLRGYLSHKLINDPVHLSLFGCARIGDKESTGSVGALRLYDAIQSPKSDDSTEQIQTLRNRVKINPVTGSAEDTMLATNAVILQGTKFNCRLELDNVGEESVKRLLGALATLDAGVDAQLGQGKSYGQGLLQWTQLKVRGIDKTAFTKWLNNDNAIPFETALSKLTIKPIKQRSQEWRTIALRLIPETPILIVNSNAPPSKQKTNSEQSVDHVFLQENNHAVIPGSTLKGLVKARCRKILLTLLPEQETLIDTWLLPAFGDMQKGLGNLRFFDATAEFTQQHIHEQTFNAIDRFSGGVKESALYQAQAVKPEEFTTQISWRNSDNSDHEWFFGLMLLVLRDAMEGDLAVGWGKAKGFGCFRLVLGLESKSKCIWINDWSEFAKTYQQHESMQTWLEAFYQKTHIDEQPAESVA